MAASAPRWGLVFLACPIPLRDEQKAALMRVAARAWFDDLHEMSFDWGEIRGTVRASTETTSLGTFIGQGFAAEVHTPEGSSVLRFLVAEHLLRSSAAPVAEA
jgi:hypothetical protein